MFSSDGRRHFDAKHGQQKDWKPSMRTGLTPKGKGDPKSGVKHIDFKPIEGKGQPERLHIQPKNPSLQGPGHEVYDQKGLRPFEYANQKSTGEYNQEKVMTQKQRIKTLVEQRNGLPMSSLGDKNYKHPDYTPNFFKDGGLIAGSTNQLRMKSGGNGKAIDFYSGLKLDQGPLNPNRKTWT